MFPNRPTNSLNSSRFCLLLAGFASTLHASPVYADDKLFTSAGGKAFMEETYATPQDKQTAAKYLYGAYASICHGKFAEARQWIRSGRYQASGEVLKTTVDSNYMLELVNAEAKRQKYREIAKSSVEFQMLNSYVQSELGNFNDGLDILKRIVLNFPKYPHIEMLKARIKAIELDSTIVPWEAPPDVVPPGARKSDLPKWRVDKFPLKVFIPSDVECAKIKGYRAGDALLFKACFDIWQMQCGGKIKFVFVPNANTADVICGWTSEQKDLTLENAVGVCWQSSDSDKYMRFAKIKVLTFSENIFGRSSTDSLLRKNILSEICLHEIGHGLGLNHSTGENDVMTYHIHQNPLVALTARDVSTANTLYTTNISEFITAALEAIWSQKYDAAETSLSKILKLAPNDQQTRETVCLMRVKMATNLMAESEYDSAIKHFIKAQSLLNGKESKKIKDAVLKNLMSCYLKTGNESAANEIDKEYNLLPKSAQNSASFLDQYGLRKDSIPHYEKALADAPNDLAIREKFCSLLVILAKDELKENHDQEAIAMLLKAKSMLVKGMSKRSIEKVIDALSYTYRFGQRYFEADNVWKDVGDILPKVEIKPDVPKTPEQDIAILVAASKAKSPSDVNQIKLAYEKYVSALRQCAIARKVKDVPGWAIRFVVLAKQYDRPESQDPLGVMYKHRHHLIDLTDEGAVVSVDIGLPMKRGESEF